MWPGHGSPAAANASLLIGAVAIASIAPERASSTASHDRVVGRAARHGGDPAPLEPRDVLADGTVERSARRSHGRPDRRWPLRDLRTDPGGVADGDADAWP